MIIGILTIYMYIINILQIKLISFKYRSLNTEVMLKFKIAIENLFLNYCLIKG